MLRQAGPQDGQDQHGLTFRQHLGGGADGDGLTENGVDLDGEVGAVLFERGDREDDDGVAASLFAQLIGPQLAPFGVHDVSLRR